MFHRDNGVHQFARKALGKTMIRSTHILILSAVLILAACGDTGTTSSGGNVGNFAKQGNNGNGPVVNGVGKGRKINADNPGHQNHGHDDPCEPPDCEP